MSKRGGGKGGQTVEERIKKDVEGLKNLIPQNRRDKQLRAAPETVVGDDPSPAQETVLREGVEAVQRQPEEEMTPPPPPPAPVYQEPDDPSFFRTGIGGT